MKKNRVAPLVGFKALVDEGPGIFEAIVSVFGNVDFAGDRVLPGAFAASLERWKSSGDPIPVIFSHQWDDLDAHVGDVIEAKELLPNDPLLPESLRENGGLWIKGRLDVDDPEEVFARRLWKRLLKRRIREFSFAYDVIDERRSSDGANDLVELEVIEVGPTLKGMNPATELLLAKSLAARLREAKTDDPGELEKIIRAELLKASTPEADGSKAVVALAGSVEERLERIYRAGIDALPLDDAHGGFFALHLEGTFDDRVVFLLEGWDDPMNEGIFYECSIESEDGDAVVLGEPVEVVVEGAVRPKSRAKALRSAVVVKGGTPGPSAAAEETGSPGPETGSTKGLSPGSTRSILDALEVELS